LILSCYHPDAIDNHGSFNGPVTGFVDWVMGNHAGKVLSCVHHLSNVQIVVDGDAAYCESYVLTNHRRMIDGVLTDALAHGRYVDRFEKRDGRWKIAERLVVVDWDRLDVVEKQFDGPLVAETLKGLRSREDASYQLLKPGMLG